jgi:hypothetical protein
VSKVRAPTEISARRGAASETASWSGSAVCAAAGTVGSHGAIDMIAVRHERD